MSTPSEQQPPRAPERTGRPSTQQIPVVTPTPPRPVTGGHDLPPPGTATPAPAAAQPTGPVELVPGLPGAGIPPPPPPAPATPPAPAAEPGSTAPPTAPVTTPVTAPAGPAGSANRADTLASDGTEGHGPAPARIGTTRPGDRQAVAGLGLATLSLVLLEVGLLLRSGTAALWSTVTLWSAFATTAAVLALAAFAASYPAGNRLRSAAIWRIAAAGLVGLSVFWVLVVLPVVASDRGFVLTAALGCLGAALWIGPRRKG